MDDEYIYFDDSFPEVQQEFHSSVSIKFGYLVDEGLITLGAGEWDWQAYDQEQKERIIEQMTRKYYYYELNAHPHEWHMNFMQALQETQEKYNALYQAVADGFNPLYSYDEWEKKRDINSDFPQTLLGNTRNADYASEGVDMERETIRISEPLDMLEKYKSFSTVDKMFLDELANRVFTCVIVTHVDALY